MTTLDEHADGGQVRLELGETLTLGLEENPTAGYRWRVDSDGAPVIKLDGDQYEAPPRASVGAPGRHVWRLHATAVGSTTIHLSYGRSFGARARAFALTVEVR